MFSVLKQPLSMTVILKFLQGLLIDYFGNFFNLVLIKLSKKE